MHYLNVTGWLFFMTWIISDMVPRYIQPRLWQVYDVLEDLASGVFCAKILGKFSSLFIQIMLSVTLAYVLTAWSVWCVVRYFEYTKGMESGKFLYAATGFLCCEYALSKMAKAESYRGFFMSVFHYTIAMGAYIVFTLNPAPITEAYSWLQQ